MFGMRFTTLAIAIAATKRPAVAAGSIDLLEKAAHNPATLIANAVKKGQ